MSAPRSKFIEMQVPAVGTAGNDADVPLGVAPYSGTISAVEYIPEATITGAATNNRTVSLINKGQSGAGSTAVASLSFGNGTNAPAYDSTAVTLSGTPANLAVVAGDVLGWKSLHVGTGITDPGGLVRVTIAAADQSV